MKEKHRFLEKYNIYYKNINIHPFCNFYFRCERRNGETNWYKIFKDFGYGKFLISRDKVKEEYHSEMNYWYK